jgi:hypothetical protein
MKLEEYRRMARLYMANELFTRDIVNNGMKTLFIDHSPGLQTFDPSFGQIISGGGEGDSNTEEDIELGELPKYDFFYEDFRVITKTSEHTLPTTRILHEIYKYYNTHRSDWSENRKLFETEMTYNMLYMFLSYDANTLWGETIIRELIELYELGLLGKMTHVEFQQIINRLKLKHLPPLPDEEEFFEELYAPKVDEAHMLELLKSAMASTELRNPTHTRKHIRVTARKTRRNLRKP